MKYKTNKLNKLEKNRYSVFTDDLKTCYLCGNISDYTHIDLHEIFEGRNRLNSIKYGYVLPLCRKCHSRINDDNEFLLKWKIKAQRHFEETHTRDEFISIFYKNYID